MNRRAIWTGICGIFLTALPAVSAPPVVLASNRQAHLPVILASNATPRIRQAAVTLTNYLYRMSDAPFSIREGRGEKGIVVGIPCTFGALPFHVAFTDLPQDREAYLLRSTNESLYILGATELAVEHAVWDVLYRLGYRQFFPGETWEIIPRQASLKVALDTTEHPDYLFRYIWYGYGIRWCKGYNEWVQRNRTSLGNGRASTVIRSAHMYQGFAANLESKGLLKPEYLALVKGQRKRLANSQKFCFSNPEIRRLLREAAAQSVRSVPPPDSISREPSDLYNWCECESCAALGSISDVAVRVANESAEAVVQNAPHTYVCMYAYARHSAPPSIRVHSNVVVNIATRLISRGLTVESMMEGWSRQGATLGVREYYAVHAWHQDLPGRGRGSHLEELRQTIPSFYQKGARFMSAESLNNWGPCGLGYYLAARMLWDVREADRLEELVEDFLDKAFGPARETMRSFYRVMGVLDREAMPELSGPLVGTMYRLLEESRRAAGDNAGICGRIDDLVLYTRYLELYRAYRAADLTPVTITKTAANTEKPPEPSDAASRTSMDQTKSVSNDLKAELRDLQGKEGGPRQPFSYTVTSTLRQEAFQALLEFGYRIRNRNMISSLALYRDRVRRDRKVSIPPEADWQVGEKDNPWKKTEPVTSVDIAGILAAGIVANPVDK